MPQDALLARFSITGIIEAASFLVVGIVFFLFAKSLWQNASSGFGAKLGAAVLLMLALCLAATGLLFGACSFIAF